MAASYSNRGTGTTARRATLPLRADALEQRLEEEISRAERHGTGLACLLVVIENLDELASKYGAELIEQAPQYLAAAVEPGLRLFDTVGRPAARELLIALPGTDGPRAEVVARRALERLRAIKVEAQGARIPLRIAVGLAVWQEGMSAQALLESARRAAPGSGEEGLEEENEAVL